MLQKPVSFRALSGVKFSSTNKKQRQGRKRPNEDGEDVRSQPKRRRVGEGEMGTLSGEKPPTTPPEKEVTSSNSEEEVVAKRSQIVVGVNEVTRGLEKATLRVAIVCLSVKSALLHDHLQVLAATRNTPCIALSGVSDAVAPAIGLKRATTIGVKVIRIIYSCTDFHVYYIRYTSETDEGWRGGLFFKAG